MHKPPLVLSVLIVAVLLIAAVSPLYAAPQLRPYTFKIGLLSSLDALPFDVAGEAGYYTDEFVAVDLIPVNSALERDQLLMAGEIDGAINDLVSTGILNQDQTRVQIVAMARRASPDAPQFRILAAPGSTMSTPADLAGVEIGIPENPVVHYLSQRILEGAGLNAENMKFIVEPNISALFSRLMEGQFKAACLPDPLAQAAIEGGAILVADDTILIEQEFSQSVISFRTEVIEDEAASDAIKRLLRLWMRAAEDINADPELYHDLLRDLLMEDPVMPDILKDTYVMAPFPTYAITRPLAWDDTMAWLLEQDIIGEAPAYEDSVNPTFLQAIAPEALAGNAAMDGPTLRVNSPATVHVTKGDQLNVRSGMGTEFDILARLDDGAVVTLLEGPQAAGEYIWWRVRTADGIEGWAVESADGVQTLVPSPTSSLTDTNTTEQRCVPAPDDDILPGEAIDVFVHMLNTEPLLVFFNSGGTLETLQATLETAGNMNGPYLSQVVEQDVTADAVPEIFLAITSSITESRLSETHLLMFQCVDRAYQDVMVFQAESESESLYSGGGTHILGITDSNDNGVIDLVFKVDWSGGNGETTDYYIVEWQDGAFHFIAEYHGEG